jgi:hypothetical protein
MDVKHFMDEIVKQIPEAKRDALLELVEKIKSVCAEAEREYVIPALQLVSISMIETHDTGDAREALSCDPDAITAVEPFVPEGE